MELNIRKGDLIKEVQLNMFDGIAHGCNCRTTMGAGIAKSIAIRWPQVLAADIQHAAVYDPDSMLGTLSYTIAKNLNPKYRFMIYNLYTQLDPGPNFDIEAFAVALDSLNRIYENCASNMHLGFPWIGCGIGGGRKEEVLTVIKDRLTNIPKLTIVEYGE